MKLPKSSEPWKSMDTFPKDGTRCQIKVQSGVVSQEPFWWGAEIVGDGFCIRGSTNRISKYLKPEGWRKFPESEETKKQIEEL